MLSAALVTLLAFAPPDQEELQLTGRVGWQGRSPPGRIVPVWVEIQNLGGEREVTVVLQWALSRQYQRPGEVSLQRLADRQGPSLALPWRLPPRSRRRMGLSMRSPMSDRHRLWAFVHENGRQIAQTELTGIVVPGAAFRIGVVGLNRLHGLMPGLDLDVFSADPMDLPEDGTAYTSLDALIWLDGDPAHCRSPGQRTALRNWVHGGGHLIVARDSPLGLSGTFLEDLLPGIPVKSTVVRRLESLRTFAEDLPTGPISILESDVAPRHVRLSEGRVPLVSERPRGSGRVTLVAFDPSRPAFRDWAGSGEMWSWIIGLPSAEEGGGEPVERRLQELMLAGSSFEDVEPPSLAWIFVVLFLYALIVGPVDYFLLRSFRKFELTWFTFPAYVIGFAGIVMLFGGAFVQSPSRGREIVVLDHHAGERITRGWSVASVLPSLDRKFSAEATGEVSFLEVLTRGGATDRDALIRPVRLGRLEGRPPRLADMRLERSVYATCRAIWFAEEDAPVEVQISSEGVRIVNNSDWNLEEVALVSAEDVVEAPDLGPGEEAAGLAPTAGLPPALFAEEKQWAGRGVEGEALLAWTHGILIGLSLPKGEAVGGRPAPELVHGMDVRRWLRGGGLVLLARFEPEPVIRFDPLPSLSRRQALLRVFLPPEETR